MIRVVLTSFEPFDNQAVNSSLEVGRAVARRPPRGIELEWLTLPVVAGTCVERAWECIEAVEPSLVLALGQAAGATALRLEARAVNVNDFRIADNAGNQPREQPIVASGPAAYGTQIFASTLLGELSRLGIAAELSASAGTYVCNHLLYGLLHQAAVTARPHRTGFIHLPLLPGQARRGQPARSVQQMAEGIRQAIITCAALARGDPVSQGASCSR
ncbi:MAG TPA: hypothetical protein VG013_41745 [Gemmataceae bacterium]|jgi:pyroglutamyl-peptidase|nr:hypothetical protein [Gemmataceae bacterium]